jgi:hypothetical protein
MSVQVLECSEGGKPSDDAPLAGGCWVWHQQVLDEERQGHRQAYTIRTMEGPQARP